VAEDTGSTKERHIDELLASKNAWTDVETIQCTNCGARETISKGEIATHCSFCGTTNVVRTSELSGLKPQGVCPFIISKDESVKKAKEWVRKKSFAPNTFRKSAEAKGINGVYSPAFTFDCNTFTRYKGVLGERYTDSDGDSHTRYRDIKGTHGEFFDDVIVHCSSNIPNVMLDGLGSYPTNSAEGYDKKYLAGFTASTYQKDGQEVWKQGKQKIDSRIKRNILSNYHYDFVEKFEADTEYKDRSFKYLLLPVYVGHHTYKKKTYNFYVNGSTGKVTGKAPVSFWKVLFTVLGSIALVLLIVFLALIGQF
jgi:hypothetical protein